MPNALSLLTAYQAELYQDYACTCEPAVLDEIPVIADLCLHVQRCAVKATGKVMGKFVLQERAQWFNLASLSDREKDDILYMPILPEGIFRSALASMQQRWEARRKEDELLKMCLPRKAPVPPPPVWRKEFTPGTPALPLRLQKRAKPATSPPALVG